MKKKYKLTPTAMINRANPKTERAYYKKPTLPLKRVSEKKNEKELFAKARWPTKKETMDVHIHNTNKGERMINYPSKIDLNSISSKMTKNLRTWVIANKRSGEVVGYTVLRPLTKKSLDSVYKAVGKLDSSFQTKSKKEFNSDYARLVKELTKSGVHVRFVPNTKKGMIFSDWSFIKARSKKKLIESKKKRVSFLPKKEMSKNNWVINKTKRLVNKRG